MSEFYDDDDFEWDGAEESEINLNDEDNDELPDDWGGNKGSQDILEEEIDEQLPDDWNPSEPFLEERDVFLLQLLRDLGEESKIENNEEFNNKLSNVISELRTNQTDIENPEQEEKKDEHKFDENLFDPKMKDLYSEYYDATGKNANLGTRLTRDFEDFVNNRDNMTPEEKQEIMDKINTINSENAIENLIKQQLEATTHTRSRILRDFNEINGIKTSQGIIKKIESNHGLEGRETIRDNFTHPNINKDIFESIDTKEEAYWLGFIYADGSIALDSQNRPAYFSINQKLEDSSLIESITEFLNGNKEKIFNTVKINPDNGKIYKGKHLCITDRKLCGDLVKHGIVPRKSLILEYPEDSLDTREKQLAFLLGYFDGDGKEGSSLITSGSKKFLKQIKEKFEIPNRILTQKKKDGRESHDLHLGVELFNDMQKNYKNSLPRKRLILTPRQEVLRRAGEAGKKSVPLGTIPGLDERNLRRIAWKVPKRKLINVFNVNRESLRKRFIKLNIETPPQDYWQKIYANPVLNAKMERYLEKLSRKYKR